MKINWKQKLASRKFWALLAALAVSVATVAGAESGTIEHITGVIGALGSCAVYIFAEAWVDGYRESENEKGKDSTEK